MPRKIDKVKQKKFKKYESSGMSFEDYNPIIQKYLGKTGKVYFPLLKREVEARPLRWCDLPYDLVVEATIDLVAEEMLYSEKDLDLNEVTDHWSDVMADWVSESEMYPVLGSTPPLTF